MYRIIGIGICLLFCFFSLSFSQSSDQITITTYYPSPYGTYAVLRLNPQNVVPPCNAATDEGSLYYDLTSHEFKICTWNGSNYVWSPVASAGSGTGVNGDMNINGNLRVNGSITANGPIINNGDFSNNGRLTVDNGPLIVNNGGADIHNGNLTVGNGGFTVSGGISAGGGLTVTGNINTTTGDVLKNGSAYINPDYVFEPSYRILSLIELKKFIGERKHLPNMPSTEEVKKEGVKIFEQNRLLLEKLEEAYLYIIGLEERISKLERKIKQ